MCDNIILHSGGGGFRSITNQGELATVIGAKNVIITSIMYDSAARDDACCLCPVDMEKSALAAGYTSRKKDPDGEHDPFDTHWYKTESDKE